MIRWLPLVLILTLAGCGSDRNTDFQDTVRQFSKSLTAPPRPSLPEQRAAVIASVRGAGLPDPVLMIELPDRNAVASMIQIGRNGDVVTWIDSIGNTVSMRNGVLLSTRGFGDDLMSASAVGPLRALQGGALRYDRLMTRLTGEGRTLRLPFSCTAQRMGALLKERCVAADEEFINEYTLRGSSVMRSRQWVSPRVGYVTFTRLQ